MTQDQKDKLECMRADLNNANADLKELERAYVLAGEKLPELRQRTEDAALALLAYEDELRAGDDLSSFETSICTFSF